MHNISERLCAMLKVFKVKVLHDFSIVCVAPAFTAFVSAYAQAYALLASTLAPIMVGFLTENVPIYI